MDWYVWVILGFIGGIIGAAIWSFIFSPRAGIMLYDTDSSDKDYFRFVWTIEPREVTCCKRIIVKVQKAELAPMDKMYEHLYDNKEEN